MSPEDRARISAEMFADHQRAMAAQQAQAADELRQWAEASRALLPQFRPSVFRGVPYLAAMIRGEEPTAGEEAGENVA